MLFLVAVITMTVITGLRAGPHSGSARPGTIRWMASTSPGTARSALARLPRVEPASEVAYDRVRDFGPAWADVDHNGCDTRNDILRRDLLSPTFRAGTAGCIVVTGSMIDPYTGRRLAFTKSDAAAIQIDHLVPLHAAWKLGAWRWPPRRRLEFANDPRNLVAVDGQENQDKSDSLADSWKPPNRSIRCVYAINTVAVHVAYDLPAGPTEAQALDRMLSRCP